MKIVFTPEWFLGKDVMIESFSFLVLLAFFIFAYRYYKMSNNKKFLYLGLGFSLIALAQVAMIITKLVLYYDTSFTQQIGQAIVTYNVDNSVDIFYYIGFFFHRLLTLAGFFIIYRLTVKKATPSDLLLIAYFILISVFFSAAISYIFHITVVVLLALIIQNYYAVYKKNKNRNTEILLIAFIILGAGHLLFVLSSLPTVFVTANVIELVSYLTLLYLIIRIMYLKQ